MHWTEITTSSIQYNTIVKGKTESFEGKDILGTERLNEPCNPVIIIIITIIFYSYTHMAETSQLEDRSAVI